MAMQRKPLAQLRLAFLLAWFYAPAVAVPQESVDSTRRPSPFPNSFGRFVNPPSNPRILEPTPPRETKGLGSFFLPLKSLSNPFRSSPPAEYSQDASPNAPARPFREPFSPTKERRIDVENPPPSPPSQRQRNASLPTTLSKSTKLDTKPPAEVNTYAANPKSETLDSTGTSRRPKNANAITRSLKSLEEETVDEVDAIKRPETNRPLSPSAKPIQANKPVQANSSRKSDAVSKQAELTNVSNKDKVSNRTVQTTPSSIGFQLEAPGLSLRMTGSDSILVGKAAPYELVASNQGKSPLRGLTIRLLVPSSVEIENPEETAGTVLAISEDQASGIAWELNDLPANTQQSLKILVRTDQPEHFAMSLDWKIENPVVQIPVRVQQPQLILALEGASEADFGNPQLYRLRVRNPGNAVAQDVRIQLQADPNGSSEEVLGDLPPGTERVVEIELTFQQAGVNRILATATSEASNLKASESIEVGVRQSQLIATWEGPEEIYQGTTAEYTLILENQGGIDSLDNQCRMTLPPDVEIIQLPPGVSRSKQQLVWDVSKIAVGEKLESRFQFALNRSGDTPFLFEADSSTGEATQSSIQTFVDAVADLALSVTDPISPAPVGKPVVYQITILNRGKKSAEDVFVIAQFSEGIEPIQIEGHSGKIVPGQALFDTIPKIEPGQELSLTLTAQASKPGTHRFRAAVRCQGSEDDLLKEESTRYASSGGSTKQPK